MRYEITSASRAEAKQVFSSSFDGPSVAVKVAFSAALDALLVPVQGEGWVVCPDEALYGGTRYVKGDYQLVDYTSPPNMGWNLYPVGVLVRSDETRIAVNMEKMSPAEAQAWADRVIAEREGEEKKGYCRYCGHSIYLQKDGVWYHDKTTSIFCNDRSGIGGFPRSWKADPLEKRFDVLKQPKPFGPIWQDDWM